MLGSAITMIELGMLYPYMNTPSKKALIDLPLVAANHVRKVSMVYLRGLLEMFAAFPLYRVVIAIAPLKTLYIPIRALIMIPTVHPMRNHGGGL
jgi:hypothetical protein